jgi:hypothetical protein
MKYLIPVIVGLAAATVVITTALAQAHQAFTGQVPLTPYLYGYAAALVLLLIAAAMALRAAKQEKLSQTPSALPRIHIENRLENIGNPIQKQSNEQRLSTPLSEPARKVEPPEVKPLPSHTSRLNKFSQFAGDTPMLLVPFRNDSVVGQDLEFSAHIIYRTCDGKEIADVARGTWFPLTRNPLYTNFETGMTREIAVLFFAEGKPFKPILHWLQEGSGRRVIRFPEVWPKPDEINDAISIIEVRLLSDDNEPLIFQFDISKDNANPFPSLLWRD